MEAKPGGGGREVRKVHIIYFLSHKGRIEHPHLVRVHHLSRSGVRLRDVKRWLSELRGKDMPESFAWSYKRRYKAGYVWQDLLDEDLITPISDNEYVLKGSEIPTITFANDLSSYCEKEISKPKTSPPSKVDTKDPENPLVKENSINSSTKTSFEIEELPSFGSETSTEDTTKHQEDYKYVAPTKHELQNQKKTELNSFSETLQNKNQNDSKTKKSDDPKEMSSSKQAPPPSNYSFGKSKSYSSSGATHMFLNLITCGIVDTNESAVTVIHRRRNDTTSMMNTNENRVRAGDKFGGSERVSRVHWAGLNPQRDCRKEDSKASYGISDSNNIKTVPAAYKFVNGPYCSLWEDFIVLDMWDFKILPTPEGFENIVNQMTYKQCGRQFNPERLHNHMKACKGMKGLVKAASKFKF